MIGAAADLARGVQGSENAKLLTRPLAQGMDLASLPRGSARAGAVVIGRLALVVALLQVGACVALPEVEPAPQGEQRIVVNKKQVQPLLLQPVKIDLKEQGVFFQISAAIETYPADLNTEIFWFYDYDKELGLPVATWQTCGGQAQCFLTICNKPRANADRHHLWAVVSNGNYKSNATQPFDFEDGVVFDAVIWEIEPENECL